MANYDKIIQMKKVVIAAGGTGGHIYPALAFAGILQEKHPECEIVFYGSSNRMEADFIPKQGYRFIGHPMTGMNGGIRAKIRSVNSMAASIRKCRKILKDEKPDLCVGFGNYISVPLIMAAVSLRIPTMIHEQNSGAGKANKLLARRVNAVVVTYESSKKDFPAGKTRVYGNPQETIAAKKPADPELLRTYGVREDRPFVLFMMGSLGSSSVSKIIDEAIPFFETSYDALVVTGNANDYKYTHTDHPNVIFQEYVDGITVLKGCELAVLRAGATTLCEIKAVGTPSILIPSPYVANDEQRINAQELADADGAVVLDEKTLTGRKLAEIVNTYMKNEEQRRAMGENLRRMSNSNAAYKMVEWAGELADEK